ncbi:MAG: hypothetical protein ABL951_02580 [Alphaproteobacteria bacterium]
MTVMKIILTALGIIKVMTQWFRDRSIHDVGRKTERAAVLEAERKANEASESVKPLGRSSVIDKLRDGGF